MAQLVKLQDYVSRYEQDLTKYINQFVRLKQQRWIKIKEEKQIDEAPEDTRKIVKRNFFDDMFSYQLRWASSTAFEKSKLSSHYESDFLLKLFLQQLPDNYLLLYDPVFQIENAPIELEAILVTPVQIICLSFLKGEQNDIYQASGERFWKLWRNNKQLKVVNPLISLQRSENVIQRLLKDRRLPMKKVIVAHDGYVDYFQGSASVQCHDKRSFQSWLNQLIAEPSPIKSAQIRIVHELLQQTRTEYYERRDREIDPNSTISQEIKQEF